jgi:adenine-specific DNA-methyltransferase
MALIDNLISEIHDQKLRTSIAAAVKKLKEEKTFGLVFEEHLPETVQLPTLRPRRGSTVVRVGDRQQHFLPVVKADEKWVTVQDIDKFTTLPAANVVTAKRFGEPIFPALKVVDTINNGEQEKPFHLLIKAENFHALQLLLYTHGSSIDVIYIDPPYNTGARDWKYDNNYVDENDQWRHSRWLSFMKKRLLLARRLLKPDGVLIVTIDDNENHHLQMLLEQCLPERDITTVVIVHNPRGNISNNFAYVHEYAHYMLPRNQKVVARIPKPNAKPRKLRRWGGNSTRKARPTMFYPIRVRRSKIVGFGEILPAGKHPSGKNVKLSDGTVEVWPIDQNGVERRWNFGLDTIPDEIDRLVVLKVDDELDIFLTEEKSVSKTVWTGGALDAGKYGASLVKDIVGKEFPYPKSLYAVAQCLRVVTADKKNATILDFFAGSGTTLHATCLLNAEDGGNRTSIIVTNNELGEQQEKQLTKKGIKPGTGIWEAEGICNSITWPRCKYAIRGQQDDGSILDGEYLIPKLGEEEKLKMSAGFKENLAYFDLEFLDPDEVEYGRQFTAILPILWMTAGGIGHLRDPGGLDYYMPDQSPFAVLLKERRFKQFNDKVKGRSDLTHIFLVTDSEEAFKDMKAQINGRMRVTMLYKHYLENFKLNTFATLP